MVNKIALVKPGIDLDVTAPAFKTESEFKGLASNTRLAGVKSIFDYTKDWTLLDMGKLNSDAVLGVEKILQKAYLDFTKDGTEAAAATAIMIGLSGCLMGPRTNPPVKYIRADKPFAYVLANKNEPTKPLFVGVVYNVVSNSNERPVDREYKDFISAFCDGQNISITGLSSNMKLF